MLGIGTDICAITRIEALLQKDAPRLLARILTPQERTEREWDAPSLARRWAAKEAVAKAFGQGIGAQVGFQEIEVQHTPHGAPTVHMHGTMAGAVVHLSVSDDAGTAIAFAIIEKLA
ncbi:MAG: holo-[acyl-carrier-protein] synthase [Proteobacteria bacterium]|nr:holo-[acyl-carrier-protein] synthase [Pseudomonadota bacterium]NBX86426.1 holo-[acyl-carrier-protein] synthase [Pseudomonadota bacterium]